MSFYPQICKYFLKIIKKKLTDQTEMFCSKWTKSTTKYIIYYITALLMDIIVYFLSLECPSLFVTQLKKGACWIREFKTCQFVSNTREKLTMDLRQICFKNLNANGCTPSLQRFPLEGLNVIPSLLIFLSNFV